MKVYLIKWYGWDESQVVTVMQSKEEAEKVAAKLNEKDDNHYVEECEVHYSYETAITEITD